MSAKTGWQLLFAVVLVPCFVLGAGTTALAQTDPGPRPAPAGAGGPFPRLNTNEQNFFNAARVRFQEVDSVSGGIEPGNGLGPTFNTNSCAACHAQPAVGGTSPNQTFGIAPFGNVPNPEVAMATLDRANGGNQVVPPFIRADGPVREARFIRNLVTGAKDGGVHGLYTIAGRLDASTCNLPQPDCVAGQPCVPFGTQLQNNNVIFRIPTPVFGLGLIENVSDLALMANLQDNDPLKDSLDIHGRFNTTGNDGTITRFGWKAQNKSLLIFAGEAYNVEQGVANEVFQNERSAVAGCVFNPTPEDSTNITIPGPNGTTSTTGTASQMSSDTVNFAAFMRLSAPPTPTTATQSELNGKALFGASNSTPGIGCVLCHSASLTTDRSPFTGMGGFTFAPYSDVALHHMGPGLADFVGQGVAGPDEFRTAPLWGVGQRIFFLHDGRAGPGNGGLLTAILAHKSTNPNCVAGQVSTPDGVRCNSEANTVINQFTALTSSQQQDILNFLRSL
jgi:CxxC motif-containing protein (DUF1111 family)